TIQKQQQQQQLSLSLYVQFLGTITCPANKTQSTPRVQFHSCIHHLVLQVSYSGMTATSSFPDLASSFFATHQPTTVAEVWNNKYEASMYSNSILNTACTHLMTI
ncbi:hypothetical protein LINGRAHAP2_LOCUS36786, partial [Linum grandiflorum]